MKWGMFLNTARPPEFDEHEVLSNALLYAEVAEETEFESAWILEHHFTNYGLCSSPLTMASFVLGRTSKINVGTAVKVLPTDHPIRIAEECSLMDQFSNGRFILGVGRGFFDKDFSVFGTDIHKTRDITEEWVEIIQKAWNEPAVGWDSENISFPKVPVLPKPYTKGGPTICTAAMSASTIEWAAKNAIPMLMQHDVEHAQKVANMQLYREIAEEYGHNPDEIEHSVALIVSCHEDEEVAIEKSSKYLTWFETEVERAQNIVELTRTQNIKAYDWHLRYWRETVQKGEADISSVVKNLLRLNAVGTPEQCIEKIQKIVDEVGVSRIIVGFESMGKQEDVLNNINLFNKKIRPFIKVKS